MLIELEKKKGCLMEMNVWLKKKKNLHLDVEAFVLLA